MKQDKIKPNIKSKPLREKLPSSFRIPYPYLWLMIAVVALYSNTLSFNFTHLDDKIFIIENSEFNKNTANIITSFKRGVFNETKDTYYRPLLLASFIIEYQFHQQNPPGYHLVNMLLHLIATFLLFLLLKRLEFKPHIAFLFALIFAVHPVLSQVVAWIPGRNDSMLFIFLASFFICIIAYVRKEGVINLSLQLLFLLLALFTKETAIIAPVIALLIIFLLMNERWKLAKYLPLFATWFVAITFFIILRHIATAAGDQPTISSLSASFIYRFPVLLQYIGKVILPVNLSVFPMMEDTVYYYGIAAIIIIAALIIPAKNKNIKLLIFGFIWFMAFMLPALLVPKSLNDQTFEHRLYIPIVGVFIMLSQSVLFSERWSKKNITIAGIVLAMGLSVVTFVHAQDFKNEIVFWESAVKTSPNSSYAAMLLGVKYYFDDRKEDAEKMFGKSYHLNPRERYTNHYLGKLLLEKDSLKEAEMFLKKETEISNYGESWFELAHIAFIHKDLNKAEQYLSKAAALMPRESITNNNLLLLYIDLKKYDKARDQANLMMQNGIDVTPDIEQKIENLKAGK